MTDLKPLVYRRTPSCKRHTPFDRQTLAVFHDKCNQEPASGSKPLVVEVSADKPVGKVAQHDFSMVFNAVNERKLVHIECTNNCIVEQVSFPDGFESRLVTLNKFDKIMAKLSDSIVSG